MNQEPISLIDAIQLSFKQLFDKRNFSYLIKLYLVNLMFSMVFVFVVIIIGSVFFVRDILAVIERVEKYTVTQELLNPENVKDMGNSILDQMDDIKDNSNGVIPEITEDLEEDLNQDQEGDMGTQQEVSPDVQSYRDNTEISDIEDNKFYRVDVTPVDELTYEEDKQIGDQIRELEVDQEVEDLGDLTLDEDLITDFFSNSENQDLLMSLLKNLGIFLLIVVPLIILFSGFSQTLQIGGPVNVVKGQIQPISQLLGQGFKKMVPLAIMGIILFWIYMLGFLLFIIPGIAFLILFMFAPWFMIGENKGIFESLGKSFTITKPHFFNLLLKGIGYNLALFFIAGGLEFVSSAIDVDKSLYAIFVSLPLNILIYFITPLTLSNIFYDLLKKSDTGKSGNPVTAPSMLAAETVAGQNPVNSQTTDSSQASTTASVSD